MIQRLLAAAILVASPAAIAQAPAGQPPAGMGAAMAAACPAGTRYATIRHSLIKDGKWATFESAVADHRAWYAAHGDATTTYIVRLLAPSPKGPVLSQADAATVTLYSGKPLPAHDAAYDAFTAKYKDSSEIGDEMRACLPDMTK